MTISSDKPRSSASTTTQFADLRRSKERAAQVAQLLKSRRNRAIEHAIRVQRQHRIHQAR